ncbi:Xanthine/uracil/vitamin C permease [Xylanimonas cellulosilytica DSM 15894]|uniref:Xanthine/uracil/vitamin C permease n=1 Tax=Xylanimonas cellulosilytica (strain DSM 15894 / JCM 12276 / CECT 5975 / KCTC 9989 / LMG 20990 / NBRC 107835 / XIL07) TaxID=446471 RepID=D1BW90_XYLCX|nr:NCS2 family permease [Xylanimonas cellulosilytica]ACZ31435.1 Xanthine/uracil/vitamin C permease [Xylanimonas cellulosilytica DSM 15894]
MSAPTTYKNATPAPATPQEPAQGPKPVLERLFRLAEHRTTVRVEVMAGLTTFFASVFTVLAIPGMMAGGAAAAVGADALDPAIANAVFIAAVLSSVLGSLLMAFLANLPFVQAPGMGLGSYLAFTVMPAIGVLAGPDTLTAAQVYQMALALVFLSGALFVLMSATGVRQKIIDGIPRNIKVALGAGIGLFITLLGLRQAGITVASASTFVALVDFASWNHEDPAVRAQVLGAVLAVVGFLVMAVLHARKIKGAILAGIAVTTVLAFVTGQTALPEGFAFDLGRQWSDFATYSLFTLDLGTFSTFGNLGHVVTVVLAMVLAHTLVNSLDSLGTIFGVASAAGMVDERGDVVGLEKGLLSDAIGTAGGALIGSSSTATVVSSASGINVGGRTGLTALTTSAMFVVALVAAPLVPLIPIVATAPALIFVGCLMMSQVKEVDFSDVTEAVPAFLAIAVMPLTFSIANGIAFALISYVVLKVATGRRREISAPAAIIGALFVLQFLV